jgi:hypothetical protein
MFSQFIRSVQNSVQDIQERVQDIQERVQDIQESVQNRWKSYTWSGDWRDRLLENKLQKIVFGWGPAYEWVDDATIRYHRDDGSELYVTHFDDGIKKIRVKTTPEKVADIDEALTNVETEIQVNGTVFGDDDLQLQPYENSRPRPEVPQ